MCVTVSSARTRRSDHRHSTNAGCHRLRLDFLDRCRSERCANNDLSNPVRPQLALFLPLSSRVCSLQTTVDVVPPRGDLKRTTSSTRGMSAQLPTQHLSEIKRRRSGIPPHLVTTASSCEVPSSVLLVLLLPLHWQGLLPIESTPCATHCPQKAIKKQRGLRNSPFPFSLMHSRCCHCMLPQETLSVRRPPRSHRYSLFHAVRTQLLEHLSVVEVRMVPSYTNANSSLAGTPKVWSCWR